MPKFKLKHGGFYYSNMDKRAYTDKDVFEMTEEKAEKFGLDNLIRVEESKTANRTDNISASNTDSVPSAGVTNTTTNTTTNATNTSTTTAQPLTFDKLLSQPQKNILAEVEKMSDPVELERLYSEIEQLPEENPNTKVNREKLLTAVKAKYSSIQEHADEEKAQK